MDVYKNSIGSFVCSVHGCNKVYNSFQEAYDCSLSHRDPSTDPNSLLGEPARLNIETTEEMEEYKRLIDQSTVEAGKKLALSLIEDYVLSRQADIDKQGRVTAMTLQLAKSASECLNVLNRTIVGNKSASVNINLDAKRSDLQALRDLMSSDRRLLESGDPSSDAGKGDLEEG